MSRRLKTKTGVSRVFKLKLSLFSKYNQLAVSDDKVVSFRNHGAIDQFTDLYTMCIPCYICCDGGTGTVRKTSFMMEPI